MRESATEGDVLQAIVKAIEALFDRSRRMELGLLTNSVDYVKDHGRRQIYRLRHAVEMSHPWCRSSPGVLSFLVSLGWFGRIGWVPASVLVVAGGPVSQLAQSV
ncbi:hypothetical protein DMB66_50190, partial [Actinoplanes sp. ATCC 53533]|uniref:hypothetical protein n=1 Tax=Actinoplanes sp. ATCC 53533 TaxID=1288362 RepID=UPI0010006F8F